MRFDGFASLLTFRAEQTPGAPAFFVAENGEKKPRTYADFRVSVIERAEALRAERKAAYGILTDGGEACVTEIFASVIAGRRTVLLNENAPSEVLADLVAEAEIDSLWGDPELRAELEPALVPEAEGGEGKILFFTSGTTDRSKAVVLTDGSLMNSAYNGGYLLPLSPEDTLLCMLPLDHVFGFVCGLLWGMSCGAAVALGRGARHYAEDCMFFRPTALSAVPALLGFLLKYNALNPELGLILIGAGGCPEAVLNAAKVTGARVCFGYGLTETSSGVALSLGDGDPYAMEICPDETVTIAPDGEVLIEAPTCVMQGYWRRPSDTENVLRDGVLYTGDLGSIDEKGKLHLTGRKKEILVLSDGTKLYLPEYEQALSAALKTDALCVLLDGDAPVLLLEGSGDPEAVMKTIRPVLDSRPRGQQIRRAEYYGKPLPRTASGKIMRWAIQRDKEKA